VEARVATLMDHLNLALMQANTAKGEDGQ